MCGLITWFGRDAADLPAASLQAALNRMQRRGPDDEGQCREPGMAMGHRRLAIMDLDHRAVQPMRSVCGRYTIVFNGEIYNVNTLRRQMEARGTPFRTTSDTEVLLAMFAADGESMLPRLFGMFAFVIWDRLTQRAFAARDPYGIKPMYIARTATGVLLASQVKALLATGLVSREPDPRGQAGFWMLGSVPEPATWYQGIKTLPAGHSVWISDGRAPAPVCWADLGNIWREPSLGARSNARIHDEVRTALLDSVTRHLVADVPVGVFLSGGIDSSALVGLMRDAGAREIDGITIAYEEFAHRHDNEAPSAAAVAAHYGIRHHIRCVTQAEFLADLPRILDAMDQPTIDGINTWYASKAVSEHGLKVVVSGIGGDELFQGYSSFRTLPRLVRLWRPLSRIPGALNGARVLGRASAWRSGNARWRHVADWARSIGGAWWLRRSLFAPEDLPGLMGPQHAAEGLLGFDAAEWVGQLCGPLPGDPRLAVSHLESSLYLRNQLLRDSDWASMDHSIELRTPLVDARLLELCREHLPAFARHPHKLLLATAPSLPLPPEILGRRKSGFGIPIARWLSADADPGTSGLNSRTWAIRVAAAYEQWRP